ncbi:helix-turn-helix domain-containing protein [Ligilactobacillus murinus]|uniref:helix-turn-helix domain-containing protein n=1 Tax=Ligilactobacillus murinus TaxID=1622 RepID=UPI00214AC46D|nr:helix-turn-helix transcriptional regulator [Ligilactobacillus murinus]MCR1896449.1 helix-turn-helix domain-containing protein [Ligilactobacillus murinus]MDE7023353.1 helix-turn-helix domain-containing protein [Ligilactobacillus sp.]MDO4456976.1 helix-turn-helix transcriptional regulator [Ligilactobacillus murinus]
METVFDRIKNLADSRGKSIVDVEADLGLSKNYLYKWKKSAPNSTKLIEVADYFNVSTDYLLGREEKKKDEIDSILDTAMAKDGKPLSENDREVIRSMVEAYLKNKE